MIEKKPHIKAFQLSHLLHHLTNIVSSNLKKNQLNIYYDIKKDLSRYIVGDHHALKKTLEELLLFFTKEASMGEIVLSVSKKDDDSLAFHIESHSSVIQHNRKIDFPEISFAGAHTNLHFSVFPSGDIFCEFSIPFIKDEKEVTHQEELTSIREGKKALIIARHPKELRIADYIFSNYGIVLSYLEPEKFKVKKPDFSNYDIIVLRSSELTPLQIHLFKQIIATHTQLKIIVMHDIFVTRQERENALEIAHAEIYRPAIIGDVEEVLKRLYIEKKSLSKKRHHETIQRLALFKIDEDKKISKKDMEKYKGCNILVLNPHQLSLKILENVLKVEGLNVYTADNLETTIEILKLRKVDLIFAEVDLSIRSCSDFIQGIRNNTSYKNIPLISISALSFEHEMIQMMDKGISAHISVPYAAGHLYTAISQHMHPKYENKDKYFFKK